MSAQLVLEIPKPSELLAIASSTRRREARIDEEAKKKYRERLRQATKERLAELKIRFVHESKRAAERGDQWVIFHHEEGDPRYQRPGFGIFNCRGLRKEDTYIFPHYYNDREDMVYQGKWYPGRNTQKNINRVAITALGRFLKRKEFQVCMGEMPNIGQVLLIEWN